MRSINKKVAAVAAGAVVVASAGAAYAYWTTSGSGSGTGGTTAGVVDKLTFTQDALTAMFPGDASQVLKVNVKNTSTENAYVSTVEAFVTTDKSDCDGSNFLLDGTAAPSDEENARALTWTATDLAKTNGNADATSTIQFNNKATEGQDACKGAVVTINYLAS
jgi:hypothetical protein